MEEEYYVARAHLRDLQKQYPHWTHRQMAEVTGYSLGWVQKWRRRFREADPDDDIVLQGLSRRRHQYAQTAPEVVQRILEIRDDPPKNMRRKLGPKGILPHLHADEQLKALGVHLPTSTRTIWRILDAYGRIHRPVPPEHQPLERPDPMRHWAIDFKDITTVPASPEGKQQHSLEVLNIVDEGTSFWLDYHLYGDFCAESSIQVLTQTFYKLGIPDQIRFDRDTRFVGPKSMRDFPSAFVRFLLCLGVHPVICPPRRPDLNPYVERLHGTLERECIQIHQPQDAGHSSEVFQDFHYHYHHERHHQGTACRNQIPVQAFPRLPALPPVPQWIDPDRWLWAMKGKHFVRKIRSNGSITLDKDSYYVQQALVGQYIVVFVDPKARELVLYHQRKPFKRIPIKGLQNTLMDFDEYVQWISRQARSERRRARYIKQGESR